MNESISYLIVGCGHFGSRAVLSLLHKGPYPSITVVDRDPAPLQGISHLPVKTIAGDGHAYLARLFSEGGWPDYVIPAVPCHLAFETISPFSAPLGQAMEDPLCPGTPKSNVGREG